MKVIRFCHLKPHHYYKPKRALNITQIKLSVTGFSGTVIFRSTIWWIMNRAFINKRLIYLQIPYIKDIYR